MTDAAFADALSGPGLGLQIGPFKTHLRISVPEIATPLYKLYQDHPLLPDDDFYSIHVRLKPNRSLLSLIRPKVSFLVDGQEPHEPMPRQHALPVLEWGLNLVIAMRFHCYLMVHAAVLERNGFAIVLPAAPGFGKTTLCAGLANNGWRLFSDEFGLIRPETNRMIPIPRPMALKNESITVIRDFVSDAHIGPVAMNTRKGDVAHLKPTRNSIVMQEKSAVASMIVFPKWVQHTDTKLQEISNQEAFMSLAANAFNYELLGERAFNTVAAVIDNARCYSLVYSDLQNAIETLSRMSDDNAGNLGD